MISGSRRARRAWGTLRCWGGGRHTRRGSWDYKRRRRACCQSYQLSVKRIEPGGFVRLTNLICVKVKHRIHVFKESVS